MNGYNHAMKQKISKKSALNSFSHLSLTFQEQKPDRLTILLTILSTLSLYIEDSNDSLSSAAPFQTQENFWSTGSQDGTISDMYKQGKSSMKEMKLLNIRYYKNRGNLKGKQFLRNFASH